MNRRLTLLLIPLAIACTSSDGDRSRSIVAPGGAALGYNDPSRIDTIGTPDLIVDAKSTANHWRVKNEIITSNLCSAIEGGVTPGDRRLLRFTVGTPNIGDADVYVGNPREHFAANDGLFELDTCHGHFHFQHYATYKLIDAKTGYVWRAAKRGFCMLDIDPYFPDLRDAPRNYLNCGNQDFDGFQGISKGFVDVYVWKLGGQYFVLDGGDGQPVVPAGNYYIEVEVNPAYAPDKKGNCPLVKDPLTGLCHQFTESNYANNTTRVLVWIAASGPSGPEKNSKDPSSADDIEY
ncbi:MAG TPA: lysyl oxidase family protein [Gemmatimonadaceae bacterium]|nr:lysyl oxidase family protein [Gemmatimonadaceae bacterium]